MQEVAQPSSITGAHLVLPTAGLAEVGDGGELGEQGLGLVPSVVEGGDRCGGFELVFVPGVDVADEVVAYVVADVEFEDVAEGAELPGRGKADRRTGSASGRRTRRAAPNEDLWDEMALARRASSK